MARRKPGRAAIKVGHAGCKHPDAHMSAQRRLTMALNSLQDLFLNELKDVLNAEKQLVQALPRMAKAAQSPELQRAFTKHLKETEGHVDRLERIFRSLGQTARGKA